MSIFNYVHQQDEEKSEGDVMNKTASTTGISVASIYKIQTQHNHGMIESPPPRPKKSPVMDSLDEFDKDCIC